MVWQPRQIYQINREIESPKWAICPPESSYDKFIDALQNFFYSKENTKSDSFKWLNLNHNGTKQE
jgi:hypothetical protein